MLEQIIKEKILQQGPVTFERFMDMALYWPELGYYQSRRVPFGPRGDYYTSAHLHPLFGGCIALQIAEMIELLSPCRKFSVIEVGPGVGYLAEAVLEFLLNKLRYTEIEYVLVERNPYLMEIQKKNLAAYASYVRWVSDFKGLKQMTGCVLMNEVIDALPVHLVQFKEDSYTEIYVSVDERKGFVEINGPLSTEKLQEYIDRYNLPNIPEYKTEINLRARDVLYGVYDCLAEGFVMVIDYGYSFREYYSEDRHTGTLLCYHRHQLKENPYDNIGFQDITAHVNFSALKDWAEEAGVVNIGYTTQGAFLVSLGIDRLIEEELLKKTEDFLFEISKVKSLLFGMGDSHRVLIQYKGDRGIYALRGFSLKNSLHTL